MLLARGSCLSVSYPFSDSFGVESALRMAAAAESPVLDGKGGLEASKGTIFLPCYDGERTEGDGAESLPEISLEEQSKSVETDTNTSESLEMVKLELPIEINGIAYESYRDETQMPFIMDLMSKDLSEPYSIYTYRYFIHGWPGLTFLARAKDDYIGAIVCKADESKANKLRGYIAMVAIGEAHRRRGIATQLVRLAIRAMIECGCHEVVLETEVTNKGALALYENLGFIRDKRLFRYYLNGVDALRLKLLLK